MSVLNIKLSHLFFFFPFKLLIDDNVAMTPFYLLLGKHRQQQQDDREEASGAAEAVLRTPLPQGSAAIREVSPAPLLSSAK